MLFDEEEMVQTCQKYGIDVVENIPLKNKAKNAVKILSAAVILTILIAVSGLTCVISEGALTAAAFAIYILYMLWAAVQMIKDHRKRKRAEYDLMRHRTAEEILKLASPETEVGVYTIKADTPR